MADTGRMIPEGQVDRVVAQSRAAEQKDVAVSAYKKFDQDLQFVVKDLRENFKDQARAQSIINDLQALPEDELVSTVHEMADQFKIQDMKATEAGFNKAGAFVQGVGDVALLGTGDQITGNIQAAFNDKSGSEQVGENIERSRLMKKAFPGSNIAGQVAGFISPASLGSKVFGIGAKGANMVVRGAVRAGIKGGVKESFAKAIGQHFITKATAAATGGTAAYAAAEAAGRASADLQAGNITQSQAIERVEDAAIEGGAAGIKFGLPFAAGGYVAYQGVRAVGRTLNKGMKLVGKRAFGKDLEFQLDNIELMQEIYRTNPDMVIAKSAEEMLPFIQREQQALARIAAEAKESILGAVRGRRIKLDGELKATADRINDSVSQLRNSTEVEITQNARNLYNQVGQSYQKINSDYGNALNKVLDGPTKYVDMNPVLDFVQKELRANGAMDRAGKLLDGSQWARTNPEAFNTLAEYWERLGGQVKIRGGKINRVNLKDALEFKKEVGNIAGFGQQSNNFSRIAKNVYSQVRKQTERADPRISKINGQYAKSRAQIDDLRSAIGRTEQAVATKLRKNLSGGKENLLRQHLESFGGLDPEFAATVDAALTNSDRLKLVARFKQNPNQVFNQIKAAYITKGGDPQLIRSLNEVADRFPELKPWLRTAEMQAAEYSRLTTEAQVNKAFQGNPLAQSEVQAQVPQTGQAIGQAQQAQARSAELQRTLPQDRVGLEKALARGGFEESAIQRGIVEDITSQAPEAASAAKNAEAARVADRIQKGKLTDKTLVEELPIIGDLFTALRKRATPLAGRYMAQLNQSSPKVRKAMLGDVIESLNGTQQIPKAAVLTLSQQTGPEAALLIYAQNGGDQDLLAALENLSRQLNGRDQ